LRNDNTKYEKGGETASEIVEKPKSKAKKHVSKLQMLKIKNSLVPMASKFTGLAYDNTERTWV
jgi:hypothetical protein